MKEYVVRPDGAELQNTCHLAMVASLRKVLTFLSFKVEVFLCGS